MKITDVAVRQPLGSKKQSKKNMRYFNVNPRATLIDFDNLEDEIMQNDDESFAEPSGSVSAGKIGEKRSRNFATCAANDDEESIHSEDEESLIDDSLTSNKIIAATSATLKSSGKRLEPTKSIKRISTAEYIAFVGASSFNVVNGTSALSVNPRGANYARLLKETKFSRHNRHATGTQWLLQQQKQRFV